MEKFVVKYLGRNVPKEGFRVFVYGPNESQRLVESWDEYQKSISSGVWFSTKEQVIEPVEAEFKEVKPVVEKKSKRKGG